jgi:hypothetical protein
MRDTGLYWIRIGDDPDWTIGLWDSRHGVWWTIGNETVVDQADLGEVGDQVTR